MLVYEDTRPRDPSSLGRFERRRTAAQPQTAAPPGGSWSLGAVLVVLRRRVPWLAACMLIGALSAFAFGKVLSPRYTAETQLYIDPRDLRLVEKELTPAGLDASGYLTIVESQTQVITSANVLNRVIDTLGLARDPEFAGVAPGVLARLAEMLGLSGPATQDARSETEAALNALEKHVTVRRTGRTFIVDVSAWSEDAEKSARIANAVAAAYLAEEASTRTAAANRASSGLSARLVELRDAVSRAENEAQAYKAANGLVGTRETLVTDQQLTQLNSQLAAARVRTADAQARFDQIQRMQSAGGDVGATEDVLASQTISAMRAQYAELSRKQAELSHDLGPRHPLVSSNASQMQQQRRVIDQEIARYAQAAKTDLARNQATVASLERSFEAAKGRTVGQAQASIRLRELEREVDANRAVYEAFLVRAQETGQQARLDVSNVRVITPAHRPASRSYPPPARVLALLGLFAGLLTGAALALAEEGLRHSMPAREPIASGAVITYEYESQPREAQSDETAACEPADASPLQAASAMLPALQPRSTKLFVLPQPIDVIRRDHNPRSALNRLATGAAS